MADFYKYHGLGNDFAVVERSDTELEEDFVVEVCHRRRGVGADGVLVVTGASESGVDGRMALYNADGTRPEMCGNGIRCVARHLVERRGADGSGVIEIETDDGRRACRVEERSRTGWRVAVEMGEIEVAERSVVRSVEGRRRRFFPVDVGNPHAVSFGAADAETADAFGRALNDRRDESFPDGANVEFVDVVSDRRLEVVVYERGVGRTRACGTGACASAAAAWSTGRATRDEPLAVELPGGVLDISLTGGSVWMSGPATAVYSGTFADLD